MHNVIDFLFALWFHHWAWRKNIIPHKMNKIIFIKINSENEEFFILFLVVFVGNWYSKCFQQNFTINLELKNGFIKFFDIKNMCSEEYQKLDEVDEMEAQTDIKLDLHYIRRHYQCTVCNVHWRSWFNLLSHKSEAKVFFS
jgi:hypothetical protein